MIYYQLEVGTVFEDKAILNINLVKYTKDAAEIDRISREIELQDFHDRMLGAIKGWSGFNDLQRSEILSRRKLSNFQDYGAPCETVNIYKGDYSYNLDIITTLWDKVLDVQSHVKEITKLFVTAFTEKEVVPAGTQRYISFNDQLEKLSQALNIKLDLPKWFKDKLDYEIQQARVAANYNKTIAGVGGKETAFDRAVRDVQASKAANGYSQDEHEMDAAFQKAEIEAERAAFMREMEEDDNGLNIDASSKAASNLPKGSYEDEKFFASVIEVSNILEVCLSNNYITVKPDGTVDIKLEYKHPMFDEYKNKVKKVLNFKWMVIDKVWRGTLKDLGKIVRSDLTLKTMLDCILLSDLYKAWFKGRDELDVFIRLLDTVSLKYKTPQGKLVWVGDWKPF